MNGNNKNNWWFSFKICSNCNMVTFSTFVAIDFDDSFFNRFVIQIIAMLGSWFQNLIEVELLFLYGSTDIFHQWILKIIKI